MKIAIILFSFFLTTSAFAYYSSNDDCRTYSCTVVNKESNNGGGSCIPVTQQVRVSACSKYEAETKAGVYVNWNSPCPGWVDCY